MCVSTISRFLSCGVDLFDLCSYTVLHSLILVGVQYKLSYLPSLAVANCNDLQMVIVVIMLSRLD